ncbi:M48 family metalloprotease [Kordiimonas aquimaris]|uniref:M48 family metalloprotease n=1 Tax=Kordiimonas aquimaris TaxID=707591 RepID=UPI0021D1D16B|nr:M48 family metalloprotease [Kordiimonas aquimaris]
MFKAIQQLLVAALATFVLTVQASSQSLLRDAETEAFLRRSSYPIFKAAGLNPQSVHMYLLNENSINAFVTGGQNIFIHSGLILAADDVDEFIGVIAHETCHIACGHRLRRGDAAANAGTFSILSLVLGAAAIAAGGADAGLAILGAGQSVARGQFLAHTRGEEAEADITGAKYLDEVGRSSSGMIRFFDKLRDQEILAQVRQDPYVRSHPLNSARITNLREDGQNRVHFNTPPDPALNDLFYRLQAKLEGYLARPVQTLRKYPPSDTSIRARYARVYAYHRSLEWDLALEEADALITAEPLNPYFHEIKGQILFENGRIEEAVPVLQYAVDLAPNEPLIATALGQALVSFEDPERMRQALPILENATRIDRGNSFAWFNLAKAYSWLELQPQASLATAERFYSLGSATQAVIHARRALDGFDRGTPDWLRAQDILIATEEAAARQERQRSRRRRLQQKTSFDRLSNSLKQE